MYGSCASAGFENSNNPAIGSGAAPRQMVELFRLIGEFASGFGVIFLPYVLDVCLVNIFTVRVIS